MEDNIELLVGIDAFGMGISLLLAAAFFSRRNLASFFLGLLFSAFFLQLGEELLWISDSIRSLPRWAEFSEFTIFIIAPSVYLYAYFHYGKAFRLLHLLHFLPALLTILNFCPLYFGGIELKNCYIDFKQLRTATGSCEAELTNNPGFYISEKKLDYLNVLQFLCYLALAFPWLLSLKDVKARKTSSLYRKWSRLIIGLTALAIVLVTIDILFVDSRFDTFSILYLTSIAAIVTFHLLRQSLILQANFRSDNYSSITSKQATDILLLVRRHLRKNDNFRRNKLTIERLAAELEIPRNKIAVALQTENLRYSDLINKLRIDKAKELLQAGLNQRLTLEAISKEAGFASKATFYKYFRKYEGTTPLKFVQKIGSKRQN